MSEVSAVLFAKNHLKVARFYEEVLGMLRVSGDEEHTLLNCRGFELVVHQVPRQFLDHSTNPEPPRRREGSPIRLDFPVKNIEGARTRAAGLGGHVDGLPPEWAGEGADFRLGHDPEGNVFRVIERPQ
jgi:predicted enzyme related to lactoylglutathione lyase